MKRKTKTGHKLITQLIERMSKDNKTNQGTASDPENIDTESIGNGGGSDFLQNLMYLYRAYASFVLEDYDSSLKDYIKAN